MSTNRNYSGEFMSVDQPPEVSLMDLLLLMTAEHAEQPAFTVLRTNETLTYSQLWSMTNNIAHVLSSQYRIAPGSRVVVTGDNHWLMHSILFAVSSLGGTLLPIDPRVHRDELLTIVARVTPRLVITDRPRVGGTARVVAFNDLIDAATKVKSQRHETPSDGRFPPLLIYNSQAESKYAMLSETGVVFSSRSLQRVFQIKGGDRFLTSAPVWTTTGLILSGLVPLAGGAHLLLGSASDDDVLANFGKNAVEHGATTGHLYPHQMAALIRKSGARAQFSGNKLRFLLSGGAPLPPAVWRLFEEAFGITVHHGFGLNEATTWVACTRPGMEHKRDQVGRPLEGVTLRIDSQRVRKLEPQVFIDRRRKARWEAELQEASTVASLLGEVLIKGPCVMKGYYKDPKLTHAQMTADGFLRTGDIGFMHASGNLVITGRLKDVVLRYGVRIFSPEVDDAVKAHPAVSDAKTVGVHDDVCGERMHVAVVLKSGHEVSPSDLMQWAATKLPEGKRPDEIKLMGYLPMANGIVSIGLLRRILGGDMCEEIFTNINKQHFRRNHPSDPDAIRAVIQEALIGGHPIRFVKHWCCGRKDAANSADRESLDRLHSMLFGASRVAEVGPKLTLILADVHAVINGKPQDRADKYFESVRAEAEKRDFECVMLSDIWKKHGLSLERFKKTIDDPTFEETWDALAIKEELIEQAATHYESMDHIKAAKLYYASCAAEAPVVTGEFPGHIWLTYQDPAFDALIPSLPKMYLFSFKEGTSARPWFED